MIRLRQIKGADVGRELELDQEVIRIGRMPDSDVNFDPEADLDASARHAEIRKEHERWILVDVGSRNGTWINGERVRHAGLTRGDEIEFGRGGPRLVVDEVAGKLSQPHVAPPRAQSAIRPATSEPIPVTVSRRIDDTDPDFQVDTQEQTDRSAQPPFAYRPDLDLDLIAPPPKSSRNTNRWLAIASIVLVTALLLIVFSRWSSEQSPASTLNEVATGALPSIYAVSAQPSEGEPETLCLAFAVDAEVLATTATCVLDIQAAQKEGATVTLLGQDATGRPTHEGRKIVEMYQHPDLVADQSSPNLGLLKADGTAARHLELAGRDVVDRLLAGDELVGFGTQSAPVTVPLAVMEALDAHDPTGRAMLSYPTTLLAGSPLLNADGLVVGLHAGRVTGTPYAVRSDLLRGLVAGLNPP